MIKDVYGYVSDLPAGCITETDVYTDSGALLCPKMTVIDQKILKSLSDYHGKIHATIYYSDADEFELEDDFPLPDDSICFDESFREYAMESLARLYANLDDIDSLTKGIIQIGEKVCSIINDSKSLSLNLSKLKVCDEYTYRHSVDVGTMAAILAKALGESDSFVKDITVVGLLHDIGKEEIPNEILNKPGKLTATEFELIKTHPVRGYRLLAKSPDLTEEMRQAILNHHENIDGSGYPRNLSGDQIGKMAQIISIVDVYDALVTARPYKRAYAPAEAIEIMFTMSNKFNLKYFKAFLTIVNIYPNGSTIKLSNGEEGVVVRQNKAYPLRPVIKITSIQTVVDLSNDRNYLSTVIVK